MQPAEVRPKSNRTEQIVKSSENQGQILAKIKIEIFDIARYTLPGIKIFALYFWRKNFYKKSVKFANYWSEILRKKFSEIQSLIGIPRGDKK